MTLGGMSDEVIPPYDRPTHGPGRWLPGDPDTWGPYENGFCAGYWQAISITLQAIRDQRDTNMQTVIAQRGNEVTT